MPRGPLICVTTLLVSGAALHSASDSSRTGQPRAVRVDVRTSDARGRFIETLTPADFEILEDGVTQPITSARLIKIHPDAPAVPSEAIQSADDERAEASRPDVRLFGIFLDEYHVSADATLGVREALARFIQTDLGPHDLVVVMRPLESLLSIRATRDRMKMLAAIERFEGRRGEYAPRGSYEENYFIGTPSRIEQLRDQVAMSAINALALHVGRLGDARKAVIVVSEGVAVPERRRVLEALPTADTVLRSANRANVSVYLLDPREPAAAPSGDAASEALVGIAAASDGARIAGVGGFQAGLHKIVEESSEYYLVEYQNKDAADGKFHQLQVRVKKPAVQVRARKGYWASLPDEGALASLPERPPAPPDPPRHVSPLIKPWFGAARGENGKTRVIFVWEPARRIPGDRSKQLPPARITLTALAPDDTSLFEGTVLPSGSSRGGADEGQARAIFDAPPGRVKLRMRIEDAATQMLDSDVRDIMVRDLGQAVALGTPLVLQAHTAREFRTLAADAEAVPVATREFSRTERLLVRVPAYAPDGASLTISAKLQNRLGQTLRDLQIANAPDGSESQIDLPLAALAPASYQLEIGAIAPAGQVKEVLEFRVTN